MKGFRETALAAALIVAAGFLPASAAHGQSREPLLRAFDIARGARIGVSVRDIEDTKETKDTKEPKAGVVVESVDPGGPANKAGIKAGDAITEFDGERVRSVRQFSRLVQETPGGRAVTVALSRNGQRSTVTVTAESRGWSDDFSVGVLSAARAPRAPLPPNPPALPRMPAEPLRLFVTGRHLGVTIETLDDQLAQYFGVKEGVLVKSVSANSVAEKAGVKAGDVITGVNGRKVYEVSDVNRALDRINEDDEFTLEVTRDKKTLTLKGKLEARSRRGISMF
jgi:serine protease Do